MNLGVAGASKGPINQLRTARSESRALITRNSESLISDEIDIGLHALLRILPAPFPSLLFSCFSLSFFPFLSPLLVGEHLVPDLPSYSNYHQKGNECIFAYFWHRNARCSPGICAFRQAALTFTFVANFSQRESAQVL